MEQQRGIQNFDQYSNHKESVSDFPMFYEKGLKGASDIDFVYEKNSKFIFQEGKWLKDKYFRVSKGEYLLLLHLSEKLPDSRVLLVGQQRGINTSYYVMGIQAFSKECQEIKRNGVTEMMIPISDMKGPLNKPDYINLIKKMADGFQ